MLKIEVINNETMIDIDGNAANLILEWMNLTRQLVIQLSKETGCEVDVNMMIKTGIQLLQNQSDAQKINGANDET